MKFRYGRQPDALNPHLPPTLRPAIRVRLSFGDRHETVLALIDSGADGTVFHMSIAEVLGIDSFERQGWAAGISGERMPVYFQKLQLQLISGPDRVEIEAAFIDSPGVGALLGQAGFFEHFRICFDRSRDEIEIRPSSR